MHQFAARYFVRLRKPVSLFNCNCDLGKSRHRNTQHTGPTTPLATMATAAAAGEGPLFSTDFISPEVLRQLPEGYNCRPLERKDYHNGFLDVLRVLTTVGDITEEVS